MEKKFKTISKIWNCSLILRTPPHSVIGTIDDHSTSHPIGPAQRHTTALIIMKSSKAPQAPSVQHSCGFPGCSKPAPLKCSRCREVRYCSKEHQTMYWKLHKKLCVKPGERVTWPAAPTSAPPAGHMSAKAAPPIVAPAPLRDLSLLLPLLPPTRRASRLWTTLTSA